MGLFSKKPTGKPPDKKRGAAPAGSKTPAPAAKTATPGPGKMDARQAAPPAGGSSNVSDADLDALFGDASEPAPKPPPKAATRKDAVLSEDALAGLMDQFRRHGAHAAALIAKCNGDPAAAIAGIRKHAEGRPHRLKVCAHVLIATRVLRLLEEGLAQGATPGRIKNVAANIVELVKGQDLLPIRDALQVATTVLATYPWGGPDGAGVAAAVVVPPADGEATAVAVAAPATETPAGGGKDDDTIELAPE